MHSIMPRSFESASNEAREPNEKKDWCERGKLVYGFRQSKVLQPDPPPCANGPEEGRDDPSASADDEVKDVARPKR